MRIDMVRMFVHQQAGVGIEPRRTSHLKRKSPPRHFQPNVPMAATKQTSAAGHGFLREYAILLGTSEVGNGVHVPATEARPI